MDNYQKEIFSSIEGDQWFNRNKSVQDVYEIYRSLTRFMDKNSKVLEIGCSSGKNLNYFQNKVGCECYGIDPSSKAIEKGKMDFPALHLSTGTADDLHFDNEYFDFVIFGFCLCLVDRKLLSRTVAEADRVTKDKGFLGVIDFDPGIPIKKDFIHYEGLKTFKYDYSKLFLSFPHYTMAEKSSHSHHTLSDKSVRSNNSVDDNIDERVSAVILYKNHANGYFSI